MAKNPPYLGDISQIVRKLFMLYLKRIYFHSGLAANK